MDRLDVRIWRELVHDKPKHPSQSDLRKSYGAIAARLHVTEETVRNRILQMQKDGFFLGWLLIPNPNLVGLQVSQLWFDVASARAKGEAIQVLKRIPGVVIVHDCLGPSLSLYLVSREEESPTEQVERIRRKTNARNLLQATVIYPPSDHRFSLTDWRIFLVLAQNTRKSYGAVAKELGLTSRTVRRRLLMMTQAAALFLVPRFNPRAMQGTLGLLAVFYDPDSKRDVDRAVASHLDDVLLGAELGDETHSFFPLLILNAARVEEILDWLTALPGVREARLDLINDRIEVPENWLALQEQVLVSRLSPAELAKLRLVAPSDYGPRAVPLDPSENVSRVPEPP